MILGMIGVDSKERRREREREGLCCLYGSPKNILTLMDCSTMTTKLAAWLAGAPYSAVHAGAVARKINA
jgi:hypothetical protein